MRSTFATQLTTLGLKLELLEPAPLSEEQMSVIQRGRQNLDDPKFKLALPLTVALFKESAAKEIFAWAKKQKGTTRVGFVVDKDLGMDEGFVFETAKQFSLDISAINQVLFGTSLGRGEAQIGLFKSDRCPTLHDDEGIRRGIAPLYIARVGALPTQFISGRAQSAHEDLVREALIADRNMLFRHVTPEMTDALQNANQKIVEKELLTDLPLGHVSLSICHGMRGFDCNYQIGNVGTPHRSTKVPRRGKHSAFFRFMAG